MLVSGQNEGRLTDLYSFDAVAGERFFLDRRSLSGGSVSWRLIGPDGEYVRGPAAFDDSGIFTLARTGTYRIALEGRYQTRPAFTHGSPLSGCTQPEAALHIGELVPGRHDRPCD